MTIKNRPHFISALISSMGDIGIDGVFSAAEVSSATIHEWTRRGWVTMDTDGDTANLTIAGRDAASRWSVTRR